MSDVPEQTSARPGNALRITGWAIGGLAAAFLAVGGVMDLIKPPFVLEGLAEAGFAESVAVPLGLVTILAVVLYFIPRMALFGVILLTGYLGGAVATHVRLGDPIGMVLFPTIFAAVLWLGLVLRDGRYRVLLPF